MATTVWFAHHGDGIVVGTGSGAGKVKRVRRDGSVTVRACNYRGKLRGGPAVEGRAHMLEDADADAALATLQDKYGLQWKLLGRKIDAFIAIDPA